MQPGHRALFQLQRRGQAGDIVAADAAGPL